MDDFFGAYFQRLVSKIDKSEIKTIQIASRDGRVSVKSDNSHKDIDAAIVKSIIGKLDIKNSRQILYDNSGEYTVIATPLIIDYELIAVILVEAINLKQGEQFAITIRTSLETFIEHQSALQETSSEASREEAIIKELLKEKSLDGNEQISYKSFKALKAHGFDLFLLRSVILIELEKKTNKYFNINLDLGYEASIETFKDKVVNVIKANKYLNNQDIVAFIDNDHIVIVKSFLSVDSIGKLYNALDYICKGIMGDLDTAKIFAYRIAYGGIYSSFYDVRKSYIEAKTTIRLGELYQEASGIFSVDQGLLEHVGYYLPLIIKDKSIRALLEKLKKPDGSADFELLSIVEEFVNQCMNIARTASKLNLHRNTVYLKIEKFKQKTGLDPEKDFRDAFLTKMAALSVKLDAIDQSKL